MARNGQQKEIKTQKQKQNCFLNIRGDGLLQHFTVCSNIFNYTRNINNNNGEFLFQFTNESVMYFTTDINISSVNDISKIINTLKQTEYSTYN